MLSSRKPTASPDDIVNSPTPSVAVQTPAASAYADANGTGSPNGLAVAPSVALIPLLRRFHKGPQIARGKTLPVKSRHF